MKHLARYLTAIVAALAVFACQGSGRVHEAPPAGYPEWSAPPPSRPREPLAPPEPLAQKGTGGFAPAPDAPEAEAADGSRQRAPEARAARKVPRADYDLGAEAQDSWRGLPSPEPRAESRPGLATHWGEQRYSPTREVSFERAHDEPDVLTRLHYNDRAGALAFGSYASWGQGEVALFGGQVTARIVDGHGGILPALHASDQVTVVGEAGERYALELYNRSSLRFEVVVSVDGLDVLDGEDASPGKRGYLLGAYQSVAIDGFRSNQNSVAAFRFGDVGRSYAASKGKARNVGVIGIALFRERGERYVPPYAQPYRYDDSGLRRSAEPFPGRYAEPPPRRFR